MTDLTELYLRQREAATKEVQFQADLDRARANDSRNSEIMADYRGREEAIASMARMAETSSLEREGDEKSGLESFVDAVNPLERGTENIISGALGAGQNILNTFDDLVMKPALHGLFGEEATDMATDLGLLPTRELEASLQDWRRNLTADDTRSDAFVTEFMQFMIPFSAGLRVFKTAGLLGSGLGSDFVTSATSMDPDVGRFIDLLDLVDPEQNISIGFVEWLRSREDEGPLEARFKNGVDSVSAYSAGVVLYQAGKQLRNAYRATEFAKTRSLKKSIAQGGKAAEAKIKKETKRAVKESTMPRPEGGSVREQLKAIAEGTS